jgi:hypothetical protein
MANPQNILKGPNAAKNLFRASLLVFGYFIVMHFIAGYRNEFVLIGVAIELFTLPMCVLLLVLFVLSIIQLSKQRLHFSYTLYSFLLLSFVMVKLLLE